MKKNQATNRGRIGWIRKAGVTGAKNLTSGSVVLTKMRMKKKLLKEGLMNYLWDNTQSWLLQSDGSYKQQLPGSSKARCAQALLLEQYGD